MDEKPPSKEALDHLASLNEQCATHFTGWTDLYKHLRAIAQRFIEDPNMPSACVAVATLLAFTHALEELPEEGDVVVIARRLNEILVTRPDLLGFELLIGKAAEEFTAQMKAVDAARVRETVEKLKQLAAVGETLHSAKTLH